MFQNQLNKIKEKGNFRELPDIEHEGKYIIQAGRRMLNVSSNDYLGLAADDALSREFAELYAPGKTVFSSSSSRLLTGNFSIYNELEKKLADFYEKESALLFNSGYHANIGILPALTTADSLILADKLVHASMIDGLQLSKAKTIRYRHNDCRQLERLLIENADKHDRVFIVTESLFSMDGDICDLRRLAELKRQHKNVLLYVDEAHAVGVRGESGKGVGEEQGVIQDLDILVGTFGKALASVGAFAVTNREIKEMLINSARSFIFTTALPPVNIYWSWFILDKIPFLTKEREHLCSLQQLIKANFDERNVFSHIFPYVIGDSDKTAALAKKLQESGYYALPIRPPTVPEGFSRIRFSLTAQMSEREVKGWIEMLK